MVLEHYCIIGKAFVFAIGLQIALAAPVKELGDWPAGAGPVEIGKRVAERFAASAHQRTNTIIYPEICAWYGALTFARASGDKDLSAHLISRLDRLITEESRLIPTERHVDFSVFGTVPLEIYIETKSRKYLDLGLPFADR